MDYFVPNFGVDKDIADSQAHEAAASEKLGHKWEPKFDAEKEKWNTPTATAEFKLAGTKADVHLESDPICNSSGCTQYLHPKSKDYPMDYPVPNFGVDKDVLDTQAHEAAASEATGHTWTPVFDEETEKWIVPTETPEF